MVGVFANWRSGVWRVLRASDLAKGAESRRREGRGNEGLQQKRVERDQADRNALYYRTLTKPFHFVMINGGPQFGNIRVDLYFN
jgi:hypothetical protein